MKLPSVTKLPIIRLWLPYLVMSVALTMLVSVAVQQNYRQNADDPQIQMAEDTAAALNAGRPVASLVPSQKVDLSASLAPFLIVVDNNYHLLASSGQLDGATPLPPVGTFEAAKANAGNDAASQPGENRLTWQPRSNVREAAVIVRYHGGYVLAARSLREVEDREQQLAQMTALTFIGLLAASFILLLIIK